MTRKKLNCKEMLQKFCPDISHAILVKSIYEKIFNCLNKNFSCFDENDLSLLLQAAMLHDIGYFVSKEHHNKHSFELIMNNLDSCENDLKIIANIARFHRGSLPSKDKHKNYAQCSSETRKKIKRLASVLKLADALANCIEEESLDIIDIDIDELNRVAELKLNLNKNFDSDNIYNIIKKKDLFEKTFKMQLVVIKNNCIQSN